MCTRGAGIAAIMLMFAATIVFVSVYGPVKRSYVIPDKTVSLNSARELENLWHSSGVHGRIAVIFTRHLKPDGPVAFFPEIDYLDKAMNQGVVRTAYYVVPDRIWTQVVSENILNQGLIVPPKPTDTGFILLHRGGRIHFTPLSKYIPEQEHEKALVVIEKAAWNQQEHSRIENYFKSGLLTADLVAIIGDAV